MGKIAHEISKMHPLEIIFRAMIGGIGLFIFAFAAWQAFESIQILSTHEKALAVVGRCDAKGTASSRFTTYGCEVKFQGETGRQSASIDKLLLKYEQGDQIDIYYTQGIGGSVKAGGFVGLWGLPTLLTVIGGLFFGFGVWPYRDKK
jgi:hypothetical protein